jgi:hypothetical protein
VIKKELYGKRCAKYGDHDHSLAEYQHISHCLACP